MDADVKKSTLKMIPHGLYVLTAEGSDGLASADQLSSCGGMHCG